MEFPTTTSQGVHLKTTVTRTITMDTQAPVRKLKSRAKRPSPISRNSDTALTTAIAVPTNPHPEPTTAPDPIYFWKVSERPYGIFSQWALTPFTDPQTRIHYQTAEHYMMHSKALLFKDDDVASAILVETRAARVKALGRKVRDFDPEVWNREREGIVADAQRLKFGRDQPALRRVLLGSGERDIVEASPMDNIWGIGFAKDKAEANRGRWGLNLLGKALMTVRAEIREAAFDEDLVVL
ncbi:hypothetical protein HKX48_009156 [Thoreauomyces humboldtii]|nr:hypothetical protein HKX48_009156 [Thoreauomyces humboldtii]